MSFLLGVVTLVGPKNAVMFFVKKTKIRGSLMFFSGFAMIIVGWFMFTTVGFLLQVYGLFLLFRSFLRTVFSYMQTLQFIGPLVRNSQLIHKLVEYLADGGKNQNYQAS